MGDVGSIPAHCIMTFDQLMQQERGNAWLQEPGFSNLYVRIGLRLIGTEFRRVIDLANFEVAEKGRGGFHPICG